MISLCDYCSKRSRCYKLVRLMASLLKEIDSDPKIEMVVEPNVIKCQAYKPLKQTKETVKTHMS